MSGEGPGIGSGYDWREHGPAAARRAFFAWSARHATADQESFEGGFVRGARWAVTTTATLSPAVASLIEFVAWLQREQEHEEHAIVNPDDEQEALPF